MLTHTVNFRESNPRRQLGTAWNMPVRGADLGSRTDMSDHGCPLATRVNGTTTIKIIQAQASDLSAMMRSRVRWPILLMAGLVSR